MATPVSAGVRRARGTVRLGSLVTMTHPLRRDVFAYGSGARCVRPFDLRGYVLDPLANPRKLFCSTHGIHVGRPVRLELSKCRDDQLGFGDGELDRDAIRRAVSHV